MKTLDEVIAEIEEFCICPSSDEYCVLNDVYKDALHYLKEYRKHLAQESDVLRQKKYELETNMKLDALLQEKPWEKRK